MKKWETEGFPLVKLSVNVSQKQFRDGKLGAFIDNCLKSTNINAQYLEIEITENVLEDFELVIPQLTSLQKLGVGISLDDFGTGYSSLYLLKSLPVDTLKIDQSFIRDSLGNERDISLVKTILHIGDTLNLNVVAEGVETEDHLNLLVQLGCPIGQGYFFSKPISAKDLESEYLNTLRN